MFHTLSVLLEDKKKQRVLTVHTVAIDNEQYKQQIYCISVWTESKTFQQTYSPC
jgi:uncharacterized protein (DUF2141 family)